MEFLQNGRGLNLKLRKIAILFFRKNESLLLPLALALRRFSLTLRRGLS